MESSTPALDVFDSEAGTRRPPPHDTSMATRVAADLRTVIESRYSHASYIPADDTTLTAENFARFDRDKVVAWLPHDTVHHGLLPHPLTFVMQEKMSGADILPLDLKALEDHFNTKFHGEALVSALHQEMTFVRIRRRKKMFLTKFDVPLR